LLANVRVMLSDEGTTKKYPDTELLLYCKRALDLYSSYFPLYVSATATGSGTDGQYLLELGWTVTRVSHETDTGYENFLEEIPRVSGQAMHYYVEGWWRESNTLHVTPTTLEDIKLYYSTRHTHPTETTSVLTIPPLDELLIEKAMCGMAMDRMVSKAAVLDRWKEKGKRDDNPIIVARHNWMKEFEKGIAQRMAGRKLRFVVKGRDRSRSTAPSVSWLTS